MNEFSKLNRDQMRKITGGTPPVCNVDTGCIFPDPNPPIPFNGVLFGICQDVIVDGCQCVRDLGNGQGMWYGPQAQCYEVS